MRKEKKMIVFMALAIVIGSAVIAYNMDEIYLLGKNNATAYIPDVLLSNTQNSMIIMTTDGTGAPLEGKTVTIDLIANETTYHLFRGVTDKEGIVQPIFKAPKFCGQGKIVIKAGSEKIERRVMIDNTIRIFVSTDKPIYQPNQVIHIRTLTFEGEDPKACERDVQIEIQDPDGNKIYRKVFESNEFGIASLDYPLSDQLSLGTYKIKVTVEEKTVQKAVLVQRYVLPKFSIDFVGMKNWYTVTEPIYGTIFCKYFFGKIVKGEVFIDVKAYYGVWETIDSFNGPLTDGKFDFGIPTVKYSVGVLANKGNGYLELNVTVMDEAGHCEKKSRILSISQKPILLTALSDVNIKGINSTYYIIARFPDGLPVNNAQVKFTLCKNDYDYNNDEVYYASTDNRGVASLTFKYQGQKHIIVEVSKEEYISSETLDLKESDGIKIVSDRSYYNLGDVAQFDLFYSGSSYTTWVYYDVVSTGFVVTTGRLQLKNDRGHFDIPITSDMSPLAEVRVYKIQNDLSVVKDSVMIGVGSKENISVVVNTDKELYRPHEDITINFNVQNNSQPIVSALGVSIVDLSVFEIHERFVGFEEIFFNLEEEFTTPQYQICSYIFGNTTVLPADIPTEVDVSSDKESQMISTWPQNLEYAGILQANTINNYWAVLGLMGILGYFGLLALGIKYKLALVLAIVLMLIVPAIFVVYAAVSHTARMGGETDRTEALQPSPNAPQVGFTPRDLFYGFAKTDSDYASETTSIQKPQRIRQFFPETWYWNPTIITDENGNATLSLITPDSITTWGVEAIASTKDAQIGIGTKNITVFQEFFIEPDIPVSVVRGDEFPLKILIYNYENKTSNVVVQLEEEDWFALLSNKTQSVVVDSNAVSSVQFMITAKDVGTHNVTVLATNGNISDMVIRKMYVEPDGKLIREIINGELDNNDEANATIVLDPQRVPFSKNAYIKLQAGIEAVVLDGAESYIHFVSGCGEQSTSRLCVDIAAYKNLLKAEAPPEKMFEYEYIIIQGIQHELIYLFDDPNGHGRAICWHHGEPPDIWLTSWALFAFRDMKDAGFDVDDEIVEDMQEYLISSQASDGSYVFPNIGHWSINSELQNKEVASTAYVTRALLYSGYLKDRAEITKSIEYLEDKVDVQDSAFTLALVLTVLEEGDGDATLRDEIADQLYELRHEDTVNGTVHWTWLETQNDQWRWYPDNSIETTGYAIMALFKHGGYSDTVKKAIKYLLVHRSGGCFGSTHDTAVAFQALNMCGDIEIKELTVDIFVNGYQIDSITFTQENKDISYLVDLRPYVTNLTTSIELTSHGEGAVLYQICYEQYLPWAVIGVEPPQELFLSVTYDTTNITVNDCIHAHVQLKYNGGADMLKMVLIDLRAPVGFSFLEEEFHALIKQGVINQYEIKDRQAVIYIDNVPQGVLIEFDYSLQANLPIRGTIQGVRAYDMYNADLETELLPIEVNSTDP